MPFSHYPKIVNNIVFACVQPPPPDVHPVEGKPNFLGRPFSELNLFKEPIAPNKSIVGYHDAQPFTRFYGSVFADQPLIVSFVFSNDEFDEKGNFVSDVTMPKLNYDAEALKLAYDPSKQGTTGRFFITIYGRWLRASIENCGDRPTEKIRFYCRGSVF